MPSTDGKPSNKRHIVFATGGESGRVRIWRADTGRCIYPVPSGSATETVAAATGSEITHLELSKDRHEIIACTGDCRITMFDLQVSESLMPS